MAAVVQQRLLLLVVAVAVVVEIPVVDVAVVAECFAWYPSPKAAWKRRCWYAADPAVAVEDLCTGVHHHLLLQVALAVAVLVVLLRFRVDSHKHREGPHQLQVESQRLLAAVVVAAAAGDEGRYREAAAYLLDRH